jgi:hypothetical protein
MSDETLIEDLVRAGVSAEMIGRVANAIAHAGMSQIVRDIVRDTKREYERVRKQEWRSKSRKLQGKPEANDAGPSLEIPRDMSRTVPDKHCDEVNKNRRLSSKKESEDQQERTELVEGRKKATRIKSDWRPTADLVAWCKDRGVVGAALDSRIAEFIDYWIAVPGQRGTKLDWDATFRNRVRDKLPSTPSLSGSMLQPVWSKPPPEFVKRQQNAKATVIRSNSGMGDKGTDQQEQLQLSGRSILQTEVSGTPENAPDDQRKQS